MATPTTLRRRVDDLAGWERLDASEAAMQKLRFGLEDATSIYATELEPEGLHVYDVEDLTADRVLDSVIATVAPMVAAIIDVQVRRAISER
jgi:hypothetical protein